MPPQIKTYCTFLVNFKFIILSLLCTINIVIKTYCTFSLSFNFPCFHIKLRKNKDDQSYHKTNRLYLFYIVFCIPSFEQNRIISKFSLNLKLSLNPSISCLLHTFHIFSLYIPPNPNLSNSTYLLYFILTDSHIRFYHISIIKIFGDFSPVASNVSLAKGKVNKPYWENTKKNYKKSGATTPI